MENRSNYKKFLLLWCGEFISSIGGGLTSFGLSIYIFQKTGSAASMGLVALLSFLPILLLSPVAGVLADRYDRCLMMMIGDGMSGLGLVYILICMFAGEAGLYQICIGVFISAVFSSLLEPSYRAIVTDMLSKDEYSKASGMMSIAGSARYLISPMIAGFLLTISDVKLLIIIDICTFILTVICTAVVRSSRIVRQKKTTDSFVQSFKVGWKAITEKKGIFAVIMITSVITCFMGAIRNSMCKRDACVQYIYRNHRDKEEFYKDTKYLFDNLRTCNDRIRIKGKYIYHLLFWIPVFLYASICK